MGGVALVRNIGAFIKAVASLANVAGTGAAQNGTSIDRQAVDGAGIFSASLLLSYSTSGGVTGGTILYKVQDSADNSVFADYTDGYGVAVTKTVTLSGTNPSGVDELAVDLSNARRYIRAVVDSDPTGGTPASNVAAVFILGPGQQLAI